MACEFGILPTRPFFRLLLLTCWLYTSIVKSASIAHDESTNNNSTNLTCSNPNEIAYSCGACDATCSSPTRTCSLLCKDQAECGCDKGYVRNKQAICILLEDCNAPKQDCKDVHCESGWVCKDGGCVLGSEDTSSSCASITCAANTTCVDGACVSAPISLATSCPIYAVASAPENCVYKEETNKYGCKVPVLSCEFLNCTVNEEPKICGACDVVCGTQSCTPNKTCKGPECGCKYGFVRDLDDDSNCVLEEDCSNSASTPESA